MFEEKLQTLAAEAESSARVPDIDDLVRRGRTRRLLRRAATGVAALAAATVAVVVAVTVAGVPQSAGPVHPGPTRSTSDVPGPTPAPSRRYLLHHPVALVHAHDAYVTDMSYADPDHAAALWETCSVVTAGGFCPQVLTWTSDGWETSRAMVIPDKLNIYALRDGSVVVRVSPEAAFIVRPDRSRRAITVVRHSIAAEPGDRLTNLPSIDGANPVGMLDTGTATLYPPLAPSSSHCLLNSLWDAHGRIWDWTCDRATGDTAVQSSGNLGRTWSTHAVGAFPILGLAVTPARTAVLLGTGQPGRRYVLGGLDITSDEGNTWRHVAIPPSAAVPVLPPRVLEPYSIATTAQGGLFLANGERLWEANQQWTAFQPVQPSRLTATNVTTGDQVICANGGDRVFVSTDDGTTWHTVIPRPQ
jgi:hypothetical protein